MTSERKRREQICLLAERRQVRGMNRRLPAPDQRRDLLICLDVERDQ